MGICQSNDANTNSTPPPSNGNSRSAPKGDFVDDKPAAGAKVSTSSSGGYATGQDGSKKFNDVYRLGETLGKGAFSVVREGTHKKSGSSFAVKIVMKSQLTPEDETALKDEINILQDMEQPHIIRLYAVYDESSYFYLITERMLGGELFDRIVSKCYYNEKEARDVCAILFGAMNHIHQKSVAHRDLKPENLLLMSENSDSDIKIADFGFAKRAISSTCLRTQCGTPGYVAPEILEGQKYDQRADMWSVGVILYILLGGYPPFIENTQRELFRKIKRGDYEFHEEYWGTVSKEARNLIKSLLTVDPKDRLTAKTSLENSWIRGDSDSLAKNDLGKNLQSLKRFNAKRKFKAAVSTIVAVNKLNYLSTAFKGLSMDVSKTP